MSQNDVQVCDATKGTEPQPSGCSGASSSAPARLQALPDTTPTNRDIAVSASFLTFLVLGVPAEIFRMSCLKTMFKYLTLRVWVRCPALSYTRYDGSDCGNVVIGA